MKIAAKASIRRLQRGEHDRMGRSQQGARQIRLHGAVSAHCFDNHARLGRCSRTTFGALKNPSAFTVLRFDGLRVVIYPNDHRPAHVHVIGRGYEVAIHLHCPDGPPELLENYGGSRRQVNRIIVNLTGHLIELCEEWERIHGPV
jgi:hypothetical protein